MHAIEATLDKGKLVLNEPLPSNIKSAKVIILLEDVPEVALPAQILTPQAVSSEQDFESLSIASFFGGESDENTDWERYFGLK